MEFQVALTIGKPKFTRMIWMIMNAVMVVPATMIYVDVVG